jgi:hypothetical protein
MRHIKQFPHCDPRILHTPGECKYCDEHPDWQELRVVWNVNFTGGKDPKLTQCPADLARGDSHKSWIGNVARQEEETD